MVDSEKRLRKTTKSSVNRNILRNTFKEKQSIFDKALRNAERSCNYRFADEIEEINTRDTTVFWNYIKQLGPQKSKEIPLNVYNTNGVLSQAIATVLQVWHNEFSYLYNIPGRQNDMCDNEF